MEQDPHPWDRPSNRRGNRIPLHLEVQGTEWVGFRAGTNIFSACGRWAFTMEECEYGTHEYELFFL